MAVRAASAETANGLCTAALRGWPACAAAGGLGCVSEAHHKTCLMSVKIHWLMNMMLRGFSVSGVLGLDDSGLLTSSNEHKLWCNFQPV